MKWYKHDSDASSDAKVKKLLLRHGAVGYAIYFHCLELIMSDFSETNITFELEHDAEIIADNLKIHGDTNESGINIVNRVMHYIIELGLFENHDGRITCMKLLKRLDTSMTSNPGLRKLIADAKGTNGKVMIESCPSHDAVMIESCQTRLDQTRLEETNTIVESKPRRDVAEMTRTIITYLNERADTRYNPEADGHRKLIAPLLKKGYSLEDLKKAVAIKVYQWKDDAKWSHFLRPSTLFRPSHIDDYIGEFDTEKAHEKQ